MGSEAVVFGDTAPEVVHDGRALVGRANAVFPVIIIGEAAAGPPEVGNADGTERLDDVFAKLPDDPEGFAVPRFRPA